MRRILFMTLTILWMAVVFIFSAQPADESTDTSHAVGRFVGRMLIADFEQWEPERQEDFASQIDFYVRKTSHAMEYALLCILFLLTFHSFGVQAGRSFGLALLCTIGYAVTDEVHQLFVPGRSGMIRDVFIDSIGGIIGISIISIYENIKKRKSLK